jgi:hypothetical protein
MKPSDCDDEPGLWMHNIMPYLVSRDSKMWLSDEHGGVER